VVLGRQCLRTASFDAVERPPDAAAATTAVESSTTTPRPT